MKKLIPVFMALTLFRLIQTYLKKRNILFKIEKQMSSLIVGICGETLERFVIAIVTDEHSFRISAPEVLPPLLNPYTRLPVLETVLSLSDECQLIYWSLHGNTLVPFTELHIQPQFLQEEIFFTYLSTFVDYVDTVLPPLIRFIQKSQNITETLALEGERLLLTLEHEDPEFFHLLVKAIEARQLRGANPR